MAAIGSVTIVGAGISGLILASALASKGVDVLVVEKNRPEDQLGTGINLQNNALRALKALGLLEECVVRGFAWDTIDVRAADGASLSRQPLPWRDDPEIPKALGIMRTDLADILAAKAGNAGVPIRYGTTVSDISQDMDGVSVTLSDGTQRRSDVLVAADGVYSPTRTAIFGNEHAPSYAGQGVWRYTIPRDETLDGFTLFRAPDRPALGYLPLSDTQSYLFILENAPAPKRFSREELQSELRERLSHFSAPQIRRAIDVMDEHCHISFRWFDVLLMPPPWNIGRVVLIGDAAHAPTPQLTSGAGLAIEDAVVLVEELERGETAERALRAYCERRQERVQTVFNCSLRISQIEQSATPNTPESGELMAKSFMLLGQPW